MWQRILGYILVSTLAGCAQFNDKFLNQDEAAPVVEIGNSKPIMHGTHVVKPGESLYEIAWQYGRDYRDIALANRLSPPYTIYPGQKISLSEQRRGTLPSLARGSYSQRKPSLQIEYPNAKTNTSPKATLKAQNQIKPTEADKPHNMIAESNGEWIWPVQGKIIKPYTAQGVGLKGIDIAGNLGTQVKSAANGKVVYSGTGLRGYGQLVIIKHNDTYLSAYGHNSRLLVKEGQQVTKGQVIAEMGNTDTSQVKLHFEIRKNGQPINPLTLLPAKAA